MSNQRNEAQQASDARRAERRAQDPDACRASLIENIHYSLERMTLDELEEVKWYIGKCW